VDESVNRAIERTVLALQGRRRQTRYCSGRCRAEASPERRILSGVGADAYE